MENNSQGALVRDCELAGTKFCPWSLSKLRQDRFFRRGLPFIRVGRSIFYDLDDVREFFKKHRVVPGDILNERKDGGQN